MNSSVRSSALALLFFCSGACALVYQVLWLRTLGWVFGVTIYAAATVWATFMAGLAVGSFSAGVLGDRVKHPLRWFGGAEMLVGATALASPAVLGWLQQAYASLSPWLPQTIVTMTAARFAMAFGALIVPTALMGATLPLVMKASAFSGRAPATEVGLLYGSNAAGAIVGTLAAGLSLIPGRGIHATFLISAGVNVMVGLAAVALSAATPRRSPEVRALPVNPAREEPAIVRTMALPDRTLLVILGVFALSGVVSLALEVVWFRVLTLFLRPTVYGFAVMLATILAGISAGSYLVTPLLNRAARWVAGLAVLELAIGVAAVLSFRPLTSIRPLAKWLTPWLSRVMPEYLVFPLSGSLLAIFPAALLMGVAFPIGLRLFAARGRHDAGMEAARVGLFYSVNVAGAIVGSLAAGFVLLPAIGSRWSLVLLASVSFASGLVLLARSELGRAVRWLTAAAASGLFLAAIAASPDPFDEFVIQRYPGQRIVSREEGIEATVVVHQSRGGVLAMTVNGNHQASTDGTTMYVHRRIGHLPMAIHPHARTALVIGLGGGATAGAVSIHEGTEVDVVELVGAVVRGARHFEAINYGVLARPNVHLRVDDGRNYLMLTRRTYDVITADVIHPIYAGSGNLYSAEYFRLLRRVLNPGGLAIQWVAGTEAEYKTIARTFLSVFPETTVWVDGSLLVGSVEPLRLSRREFDWKLQVPGRARGLHDLGIESFEQLGAAFRAGPDELRTFVGPGPVLTDDRPLAEYFLSLPRDRDVDLTSLKGDARRYVVPD